jgi:hypothetical protein
MSANHLYSDTESDIVDVEKTIRGKDCLFTVEVKAHYSTWREVDEDGRGYTHTEFNGYETRIFDEEKLPKMTKKQKEEIILQAQEQAF